MKHVVFDFDGTIARGDAVTSWLWFCIARSPVRFVLAFLALPVACPLLVLRPSIGASVFLWIATVGLSPAAVVARLEAFAEQRFERSASLFEDALEAIARHQSAGDQVFVASGCEFGLLSWVCSRIGLEPSRLVGSTLQRILLGNVADEHCVGRRKVAMLYARTGQEVYDHVYTDSWRDLPLMQRARQITLVNASAPLAARIRMATAADVTAVNWGKLVALPPAAKR